MIVHLLDYVMFESQSHKLNTGFALEIICKVNGPSENQFRRRR